MAKNTTGTKKIAKALLAGTCLAGAASAGTITEGVSPGVSADFTSTASTIPVNDHFAPPVTTVVGSVGVGDVGDYFEFTDLLPGSAFTLDFNLTSAGALYLRVAAFEDSGFTAVAGPSFPSSPTGEGTLSSLSGTVPGDGNLIVGLDQTESISVINYSATLTATPASSVPEPETLPMAALGLAGALAWRRRRKP